MIGRLSSTEDSHNIQHEIIYKVHSDLTVGVGGSRCWFAIQYFIYSRQCVSVGRSKMTRTVVRYDKSDSAVQRSQVPRRKE